MPLPSPPAATGNPLSFNDLNVELTRSPTAQLTMSYAADELGVSYTTNGSDQLGMDEFYGKSYVGYATSISVTPTTSTIIAEGETKTYQYTANGAFGIVSYPVWATPSIQSGSTGTNISFTVAFSSQALDAAQRTGTISLQSPLATTRTISVTQSANPATVAITQQTGPLTYDYRGGTDEYYKIETSPESQISWNATLSSYTGFAHRIGSSGAFSQTTLSGTGDAFIYLSGSRNDSITDDRTATITVDPQNIGDPNVTDTLTVQRKPNMYYQVDVGGGNFITITSFQFTYDQDTFGEGKTIRVYSNFGGSSVSSTLIGTNSNKFTLSDQGASSGYRTYVLYPNSYNTSGGTYSATVRTSLVDLNFDLSITQTSSPAPTLSITPDTLTWAYNDTSNKLIEATYNNFGNAVTNINFTVNSPYFRLTDYSANNSDDGGIVVSNPNGNVWVGQNNTNPSSYSSYKVYVTPKQTNSTAGSYTATVTGTISTSTGTGTDSVGLTQTGAPAFTSADWNGSVSVSSLGAVSVTQGNSTTIPGFTPTSFATVTTATSRTITISNVTVPSGYSNAGSVLADFTRTATQPAAPRTLNLTANATTVAGNVTSVTLTIDDVYYTTTDWQLVESDYDGTTRLQSVSFNPQNTGTGDETRFLSFASNTSGTARKSLITLSSPTYGTSVNLVITQNSYTPDASITSVTDVTDWAYNEYGASYAKTVIVNVSGVHTGLTISLNSEYFALEDYSSNDFLDGAMVVSNPYGNVWTATSTNGAYFEYRVAVKPTTQNNDSADRTTTLTVTLPWSQNGGGSAQHTQTLRQTWNPYISTTPTSMAFVASAPAQQSLSVTSNIEWTATITGTGFRMSDVSGGPYATTAITKTGNSTLYVRPTNNLGSARSGTLTLTGTGTNSGVSTSVSLAQDAAVTDYYYEADIYYCFGGVCEYQETTVVKSSTDKAGYIGGYFFYTVEGALAELQSISLSTSNSYTIDNNFLPKTTCSNWCNL